MDKNIPKKLVVIDGNSIVNRAYYALPPLTNLKGEFTNAVYGFMLTLNKIFETVKPDYLAVAFDLPEPTFRHKLFGGYKATRKGMPLELAAQMPMLKNLLSALKIKIAESPGYEADDILGTYAKKFDGKTVILTGDRDSYQLISPDVSVYLTRQGKGEYEIITENTLKELYGLTPQQMIELKSLMGDSSDCIPGVPGVGEKTALKLISEYGSLDGVYRNLDSITGALHEKLEFGRELAYISKKLAIIDAAVPVKIDFEECVAVYPYSAEAYEIFRELGFRTLLKEPKAIDNTFQTPTYQLQAPQALAREVVKAIYAAQLPPLIYSPPPQTVTLTEPHPLELSGETAVVFGADIKISDGRAEYVLKCCRTLIDDGQSADFWLKYYKDFFENEKIKKVFFESKAARHILAAEGVALKGEVFDVQLAQYVIDNSKTLQTFDDALKDAGLDGGAPASKLLAFKNRLVAPLENYRELYYNMELPVSEVLFDMERTGICVDIPVLDALAAKFRREIDAVSEQIYALSDTRFNIASPKQLGEVLFSKLQIPYPQKKTSSYSTAADILEPLAADYEIVGLVLKHRALSKLNGTYAEGLKKAAKNGVVHTDYRQCVPSTGRLSSVEPNLQNIPVRDEEGKEIRRAFVPREGCAFLSADYSQIELRLLAHFSGEEKLVASFCAGEDIHARTAGEVNGVSLECVTKEMRREAKAVNFGIIYGISNFGLAQGLSIPPSRAKGIIDRYFENYPKVRLYLDGLKAAAKRDGYLKTLFGRIRYFPELTSPNFNIRAFGERAAMNMPLQGTAADIVKLAMLNVQKALRGLPARIILQVHDEIIIEAEKTAVEAVKKILKHEMENVVKLRVPLTADVTVSETSWYDL